MGLNEDAIQMLWRQFPALILALGVILCLANHSRYQKRLAKNFSVHATRDGYTKGD